MRDDRTSLARLTAARLLAHSNRIENLRYTPVGYVLSAMKDAEDEKLKWLLGVMRDECKKIGRDPKTIEVTSGRAVPTVDSVKELTELGVSRFMVPPPAFDPVGITEGLEKLGELIAKVG